LFILININEKIFKRYQYHQRLISIRLGEVDGGKNVISEDIGKE